MVRAGDSGSLEEEVTIWDSWCHMMKHWLADARGGRVGISGGPGHRGQILSWGGREVSLPVTAALGHKATPPMEKTVHNLSIVHPGQAGGGCESFFLPWGGWCHLVPLASCRAFPVERKPSHPTPMPQADPRLYDPVTSPGQSWTLYSTGWWVCVWGGSLPGS